MGDEKIVIYPEENIDIFSLQLSPEEGFVLSRITGKTNLKELSLLTGIRGEKLKDLVLSLAEKGVIKVEGIEKISAEKRGNDSEITEIERILPSSGKKLVFEEDIINVFVKIRRERLNGFLRVRKGNNWKMVFFMKGNPVYAVSNIPGELLGNLLVAARAISREELERFLKESEAKKLRLGELLVEKGVLSRTLLQKILRKQVELKVIDLLLWNECEKEFTVQKNFDLPFIYELSTGDLLVKALRKKLTNEEITRFIEERLNFYIYPAPDPVFSWGEFELDQKERILVDIIKEKPRLVREVVSLSPLMVLGTYRILTIFIRLGMVVLQEKRLEEENVDIIVEKLKEKLEKLYRDNYFERLVLHESAVGEEVKEAYRREKENYSSSKFPDDERIKELLAKINALLDEAYENLKDQQKRIEYRKSLFSQNKLAFEASIQYEKGELELLREEFRDAYYLFKSARELNPDVPEYLSGAALTGYLYYRGLDDEKASRYLKDFMEIVKKFPHREKVLYHGYIFEKFRGNKEGARRYIQRILEINPENRDALKALKEL